MTITVIVHALEAVLGLLVVALGYRVARQYRYDCSDTELLSSKSSNEVFHTHDKVSAVANIVVKGSQSTTSAVSNDPESASKPSSILDDYIGGFFDGADVADTDVKSFRAVDEHEVESLFETTGNEVSHVVADINAASNSANDVVEPIDLSEFKATSESVEDIPVLESRIPESLVTERFIAQVQELDSEVILVEDDQPVLASESVMSDKVVLAMLDEAKLVSTS